MHGFGGWVEVVYFFFIKYHHIFSIEPKIAGYFANFLLLTQTSTVISLKWFTKINVHVPQNKNNLCVKFVFGCPLSALINNLLLDNWFYQIYLHAKSIPAIAKATI